MALKLRKSLEIGIVIDSSGSLQDYGEELKKSIRLMIENIKKEPYFQGADVYLTLMSFAESKNPIIDAQLIQNIINPELNFKFEGRTNPGPAIKAVVGSTYERYRNRKDKGEEPWHPLLFFFTDGKPYPEELYLEDYKRAAEAVKALEKEKKLFCVTCAFGNADRQKLELMTNYPERVLSVGSKDIDKLSNFFKEIIPRTAVTASQTGDLDQLKQMFVAFNN